MATLYTDVMTGQASRNVRQRQLGTKISGDMRMHESTYTTTALEVTNDVLQICQIPVGAIFLPEDSWFWSEGLGGTTVIITSVGDLLDAARYNVADLAVTAASTAKLTLTPVPALILTRYAVLSTSNIITATLTGTFPLTTAKKLICHMRYRMP